MADGRAEATAESIERLVGGWVSLPPARRRVVTLAAVAARWLGERRAAPLIRLLDRAERPALDELLARLDAIGAPADAVAGRDDEVWRLIERLSERLDPALQARGVVYTPADLAHSMVRVGLERLAADGWRGGPLRVLDPACGAGTLLAVARSLAPGAHLVGHDIDPVALAITRGRLADHERLSLSGEDLLTLEAGRPRAASGVDLVVSNPPYVRHERLDPDYKRAVRRRHGAWLGQAADLSAYFVLEAVERARPGGVVVLLTGNSWLDVRYGEGLRRWLAREARVHALVESRQTRAFSGAAVNAVLLVITRDRAPAGSTTALVSLDAPLAHLDGPGRRRSVSSAALGADDEDGSGPAPRWGALLRAPERYDRLAAHPRLVPLGALAGVRLGRGRRTGADRALVVGPDQRSDLPASLLEPLARSPQQFMRAPPLTSRRAPDAWLLRLTSPGQALEPSVRRHLSDAGRGIDMPVKGRPWYMLGPAAPAHLLLPVAVHDRHFVVHNDAGWEVHQRFGTLSLEREDWAVELAAILSSFLVPIGLEVLGRRGLGEGALDVPPSDWRELRILDPRGLEPGVRRELRRCWAALSGEPPLPLALQQRRAPRRALDLLVAGTLGLDPDEATRLGSDALELVEGRLAKASRGAGSRVPED